MAVQCEECTCSPDGEGDSSLSSGSSSSSSSSCSSCSTSADPSKKAASFLLSKKWIDKQNTIQEEDEEYDQEDTDTDQIIVNVPKLIVKGLRTT